MQITNTICSVITLLLQNFLYFYLIDTYVLLVASLRAALKNTIMQIHNILLAEKLVMGQQRRVVPYL